MKANFLGSFGHAFSGWVTAAREERNFRVQLAAAVVAGGLCFWLRTELWQNLWVGLVITLVLLTELFNSAIERVVDLASPEEHHLARAAKDFGAGASLLSSLFAATVGLVVFGPPLWKLCCSDG